MARHTDRLDEILARFPALDLPARLAFVAASPGPAPVFTTSLGKEDQVITAAIAENRIPIRIVTLNTGRLFRETVELIEQTEARYKIAIGKCEYDAEDEAAYVETYGVNGFYDSLEARHACCGFRKLKPLARVLRGTDHWITGLRRDQSAARNRTRFAEWDGTRGLIKINPLADWDSGGIKAFIADHDIPVNRLHGRGYPSIGCEPCTRAVRPGEPERAGRWWWENDARRECGLHTGSPADAGQGNAEAEAVHV